MKIRKDLFKIVDLVKGKLNSENKKLSTELIEAIKENKVNIAQLLLEQGAKIDYSDDSGKTALQYAIENQMIAKLLSNIKKIPKIRYRELEFAIKTKNYDFIRYWVGKSDLKTLNSTKDIQGNNILDLIQNALYLTDENQNNSILIVNSNNELFKLYNGLLRKGMKSLDESKMRKKIIVTEKDLNSKLIEAIKENNYKHTLFFLNNNADINYRDNNGNTVINHIILNQNLDSNLLKLIFLKNPTIDSEDLKLAIRNKNYKFLNFWIEKSDLQTLNSIKDSQGNNIFHIISMQEHDPSIKINISYIIRDLLKKGMNKHEKNIYNVSALSYLSQNHSDVLNILSNSIPDIKEGVDMAGESVAIKINPKKNIQSSESLVPVQIKDEVFIKDNFQKLSKNTSDILRTFLPTPSKEDSIKKITNEDKEKLKILIHYNRKYKQLISLVKTHKSDTSTKSKLYQKICIGDLINICEEKINSTKYLLEQAVHDDTSTKDKTLQNSEATNLLKFYEEEYIELLDSIKKYRMNKEYDPLSESTDVHKIISYKEKINFNINLLAQLDSNDPAVVAGMSKDDIENLKNNIKNSLNSQQLEYEQLLKSIRPGKDILSINVSDLMNFYKGKCDQLKSLLNADTKEFKIKNSQSNNDNAHQVVDSRPQDLIKKSTKSYQNSEFNKKRLNLQLLRNIQNSENASIIANLIKNGANVNYCDKEKKSCLYYAIKNIELPKEDYDQKNALDIMKVLIVNDVDINFIDELHGLSCLHWAVKVQQLEIVKLLVSKKNELINLKANDGTTPLHVAAFYGHSSVFQYLVSQKNINLNDQDNFGNTILSMAIRGGNTEIINYLLKNNTINLRITDKNNTTIFHTAADNNEFTAFQFLIKECSEKNQFIFKDLLNAQDIQGNTPLHIACSKGNPDIINTLLKENADSTILNHNKQTPIKILKLFYKVHSKKLSPEVKEELKNILSTFKEKNTKHNLIKKIKNIENIIFKHLDK